MNSKLPLLLVVLVTGTAQAASPQDYAAPQAGQVRIIRDHYGVPHLIAQDNRSLFFGVGYVQAEDQLENLALNYLRSVGRAAEREGESQLPIDALIQAMDLPERAQEIYANLDAETKSQWEGFAAGVNQYITENRARIPAWIEPIEPFNVMTFAMYIDAMFALGHCQSDLASAGIKLSSHLPRVDHGQQFGSNQFAVSPARSATGACMLSMDPHLRLSRFFRWYEMHLVGPEVNVMGACFFGSPYVSMGRSAQTAWCMTVNGPDLGDVFTFQINPDDPTQYKSVDGWKKFETEMNTIKVLQHDGGLVERSFPALRTAVGPVVTVKDGTAYVFALPMSNDAGRARQLYEMMKAQTMPEFREALKPLGLVMFNILYADKHGDVFWVSNGRIPKRDPRIDSKQLRPGDQQAAQWQGFHALDELPQVTNPSAGYVVNANSGPQNVTPIGAPNPADFPPYMMSHQANSRLRRLDHLLRSDESLTFEEMQTYATDTTVEVDPQFKDQICALGGQDSVEQDRDSVLGDRDSVLGDRDSVEVGQGSDTELLNQVAKVLQAWDHRTDLDSRGAVLFHYLAADKPLVQAVAKQDSAAVATAVVRVAKQVQQLFGAIDVTWDQFSRIRRGQIELAVAGSGGVGSLAGAALRPTYGEVVDGKRYCSGGSSYGMIVDFSGQTKAISCLPFGVSEDPESPYFANMLPLYVERKFKPAWFLPAEVKEHTASEKTLATD